MLEKIEPKEPKGPGGDPVALRGHVQLLERLGPRGVSAIEDEPDLSRARGTWFSEPDRFCQGN